MMSIESRTATVSWLLAASLVGVSVITAKLLTDALQVRYERDVSRMVFNDNVELLDELRRKAGLERDSLTLLVAARPAPTGDKPYIVVSIEEHRLWFRQGDSVLFAAPVATGSGKVLEGTGAHTHWKFETPRGRLSVVSKDTAPMWVAPDWYYVEEAQRRGLGVLRLDRGQRIRSADGSILTVVGSDVVRLSRTGQLTRLGTSEGAEMVFGGNLVIPPFGTNQRKYPGVLGTHRLSLGGGYAIHGTNKPETIGRSVSHGCVRLRNEDIARLYELVPIETPVFIY